MLEKEATLKQIEKNIKVCSKCRLCEKATNSVPGEGNINSKIVFVGEAPGETEDKTGRPFVGRAGKLLEKGLEKLGMHREDVWIGNIIKHRPPDNRDPLPDEISACEPYLALQLKAIAPLVVITLGRFSMNYFYAEGKISKDHGRLLKCKDFWVYPLYHPAAALRNPTVMKDFVRDFMEIPNKLKEIESVNSPENNSKLTRVVADKHQPQLEI